ncbi:MAG TPA: hypothetical protein VNJ54_17365 [Plantibacter sp.]|uniref:hypothetical protein n=1 Tax=unclassified Plantibacter TaxID=2624265 RepID=UPI002BC63172|nr:hypothetical protein [Plantibacter sp.]
MALENLFPDAAPHVPRTPRTVRQVIVTVLALVAGGVGVVALLGLLLGSFQGTYSSLLEGDVSTCGYAGVGSTCQDELRERVQDVFHIPLSDDVRVEQLRRYGFPDPTFKARLIFPSADAAVADGFDITEMRPGGRAMVELEVTV